LFNYGLGTKKPIPQWFFRQGRYDRGEAHRQQWLAEIAEVEVALFAARPSGDIINDPITELVNF
jgi:hypothetical protein